MRISDWSSDVCSSDLRDHGPAPPRASGGRRAVPSGVDPDRAWTCAVEELPGAVKQVRRRPPPNAVMPANLGNPSDSFAPPCRHSRESGNPVPLPALDRKAESRWVPAFAGMTIKVDQANPELERPKSSSGGKEWCRPLK